MSDWDDFQNTLGIDQVSNALGIGGGGGGVNPIDAITGLLGRGANIMGGKFMTTMVYPYISALIQNQQANEASYHNAGVFDSAQRYINSMINQPAYSGSMAPGLLSYSSLVGGEGTTQLASLADLMSGGQLSGAGAMGMPGGGGMGGGVAGGGGPNAQSATFNMDWLSPEEQEYVKREREGYGGGALGGFFQNLMPNVFGKRGAGRYKDMTETDFNKALFEQYADHVPEDFGKVTAEDAAASQNKFRDFINQIQSAADQRQQTYQARYDRAMGELDKVGDQARKDLSTQFKQAEASAEQGLASRGLLGTTMGGALTSGFARDKSTALGQLNESLARERIGWDAALSGDTLNALERGIGMYSNTMGNEANFRNQWQNQYLNTILGQMTSGPSPVNWGDVMYNSGLNRMTAGQANAMAQGSGNSSIIGSGIQGASTLGGMILGGVIGNLPGVMIGGGIGSAVGGAGNAATQQIMADAAYHGRY